MKRNRKLTDALLACWRYKQDNLTRGRVALFEAVNDLWTWRMMEETW